VRKIQQHFKFGWHTQLLKFIFAKFVSIRKEAVLSVPYEVYPLLSMFYFKKIRELHAQKICENGQGKNPRDTGTSLAAKRANKLRFCRSYLQLSKAI
jgi:hypothetical protein